MRFFWQKKMAEDGTGVPAHLESGLWGEEMAEKFLKKKGYRILGRRVRVGRRDEIDLVARAGEVLVFVEVKTRRDEEFGRPVSAVDREKQRALSRAAIHYLKALRFPKINFRIDVIEVVGAPGSASAPMIRHLEAAFPLDRRYRVP